MVPPFPSHPFLGGWVSLCSQLAWCPEPGPEPDWGGTVPWKPGLCQPPAFPGAPGCNLTPWGPASTLLGGVGKVAPAPVRVPGLGFPYLLSELRAVPCTQWHMVLERVGMWPPF